MVLAAIALLCWAKVGSGWFGAGLFVALAGLVVKIDGHTLTRLDGVVAHWFASHRSHEWQREASDIYSYLGQPAHFAVVVVFCATLLGLQARSMSRAALVIAVVGTGVMIEETLKAVVERPFPSGHVTAFGTFLGMVMVCLSLRRSPATKAALALVAATGVLGIAFLALYSGAHSVTDVAGGMVLSGALVALGAAVLRAAADRAAARRRPALLAAAAQRRAVGPQHAAAARMRRPHAVDAASVMAAHTAPLRTDRVLYSRGY